MAFVPLQTIEYAIADCGMLADTSNIIVDDSNADKRISAEAFNNNSTTCLYIEFSELEDSWKTYSTFSIAGGRIKLRTFTKVNIWAFLQWTRYIIRLDKYPTSVNFNVA